MSVREKLNESKLGVVVGVALIAIAGIALYFYMRPAFPRIDATQVYYSDDDGASYYRDSVYNFPPYDHDGKTAYEAMVFDDNGKYFIGYLVRYAPEAHQKLVDKYKQAVASNLSSRDLQQKVLDYLHSAAISWQMEVKLPGAGNKWLPRSALGTTLIVKGPSGEFPDRYVFP